MIIEMAYDPHDLGDSRTIGRSLTQFHLIDEGATRTRCGELVTGTERQDRGHWASIRHTSRCTDCDEMV